LQESFTVTLGAQMKQMHNLRIVAANIMGEQALPLALFIQRMMPAFVVPPFFLIAIVHFPADYYLQYLCIVSPVNNWW
jgi:hypothetical protein